MIRGLLLLPLALTLVPKSCQHTPVPAPLKEEQAVGALSKEQADSVAAYIAAGRAANERNPEGAPKEATEESLAVVAKGLPAPSQEKLAEAMRPVNAALAGDLEAARKDWAKAAAKADLLAEELDKARQALAAAIASGQRERDAAVAQAKLDAALKAQALQAEILTWGGALLLLAFGLTAAFSGVATIASGGWMLGVGGMLALGLAQLVSQDWYKWAVLGALSLLGAAIAWHATRHKKAAAAQNALKPVVEVLDKAYDNGTKEQRDLLDELVFNPLSNKDGMSAADKAAIHQIRVDTAT